MKAWRFYGFGDFRLDDIPVPELQPRHVLVEPLCVQPSVTEAQLAFGIPTLAFDRVGRRLATEAPIQLFGHEFCARIVETGPGVSRFKVGDRIAARAKLPCEKCSLCLSERSYLCRKGPVIGFDQPGCFSEVALLPEIALVRVDDCISDSEAACLQSLSDSVAAVETAGIQMGDSVVIFGQGSMGLECMQIARISGAGKIITVDVRDESCRISKELGADYALNSRSCNVVEAIRELTEGNGADVVFECAGGSPKQGMAGTETVRLAARSSVCPGSVLRLN
jgi:threonine dehydrogenase-like Zn-dependent dehydrogenase